MYVPQTAFNFSESARKMDADRPDWPSVAGPSRRLGRGHGVTVSRSSHAAASASSLQCTDRWPATDRRATGHGTARMQALQRPVGTCV